MIRTGSNRLMSSYVNVDGEPIFYKTTNTSWVANELNFGRELFYMECIREPPEWFLWVWHVGIDASDQFVANIRLFKVGHEKEMGGEERSWTGGVIPMRISKDQKYKLEFWEYLLKNLILEGYSDNVTNTRV